MAEAFQNAMAVVRELGKPSLFITFTANNNWPDITDFLEPFQDWHDRPDLVAKAFNRRLNELLEDLKSDDPKRAIFGKVKVLVHVVEYQKRSLPHAHILIIMEDAFKLDIVDKIDSIISAEFPNPTTHPLEFKTVLSLMTHKCGTLCEKNEYGMCTKGYPKKYREFTEIGDDAYPLYRRREDGKQYEKNGTLYTNVDVIPHNLLLIRKYDAHINVESVASIAVVKYFYKYIYKGQDRAVFYIKKVGDEDSIDEIKNYKVNCVSKFIFNF